MKTRETPLVTNIVARDLVLLGRQDSAIAEMWADGCDTYDIARALTVHESVVANRRAREPEHHAFKKDA